MHTWNMIVCKHVHDEYLFTRAGCQVVLQMAQMAPALIPDSRSPGTMAR